MYELFQNLMVEQATQCKQYIEQASSILVEKVQVINSAIHELNTTIIQATQNKLPQKPSNKDN